MAKGKVKWFNAAKGFGFIEPEEGGADAFVHITAVQEAGLKQLLEGQQVEYDLLPAKNGKDCAMNLKLAEGGDSEESSEPTEPSDDNEESEEGQEGEE